MSTAICSSCTEFVKLLKQGGMGALELVAMELKGAGAFVSRALSWSVSGSVCWVCDWLCREHLV
jgi:hypothetical protein